MTPAKYETTSVKIDVAGYRFTVAASKLVFDGFASVYMMSDEEEEGSNTLIKGVEKDSEIKLKDTESKQHFTQPPAHYTEAALVKTLEELGIGRPSTYSPTISTIIARHYVAKENKNLYATELGEVVNSIMKESFPSIVNVNFTANLESLFDKIGEGVIEWKTVIRNFYPDLDEAVNVAEEKLEKVDIADEVTDVICDRMRQKYGCQIRTAWKVSCMSGIS